MMDTRSCLVAAMLCLLSMAYAVQPEVDGHVVEPNSSVKFPVTVPGEKGSLYLTGTAIRVKKIVFVSVQVYAVGLYTDKKAAQAKLTSKVSPALFSTLLSEGTALPLTVRLEMVRDVGGDKMSAAFKEAIEPRLASIYKDAAKTNADMDKFTKQFDMASLATGTVLTFTKTAQGKLITEVAGVSKGEIDSPALCKAFLSVFLGDDAVVEREGLVDRLPLLLSA